MNFVCGFLLIVLDDELDVFCCLVALVQKLLPGYLHTVIPSTWLAAHPPYRGLLIPDSADRTHTARRELCPAASEGAATEGAASEGAASEGAASEVLVGQ